MATTTKNPFVPVPSPFVSGKIDEQASTTLFEEYVGGVARAQQLLRILKTSYPHREGLWNVISATELFRCRALREGFTEQECDALLVLQ